LVSLCLLHLHALHSFPTRRSSDLPSIGVIEIEVPAHMEDAANLRQPRRVVQPGATMKDRDATHPVGMLIDDEQVHRPAHAPQQRDRKSTRLNSSHGSISYAVFCLT